MHQYIEMEGLVMIPDRNHSPRNWRISTASVGLQAIFLVALGATYGPPSS